jgi:iron complex transport system substrate-binding protein
MKKTLTVIFLWGLCAGCARRQASPTLSITDDAGRTVGIAGRPGRIVSLAPSVTEIIYALNAQDRLVGVTSWCNYPPAAKQKTVVGDATSFNPEMLLALKPDLAIMAGTAHSSALARLEAIGITVLVLDPKSPDDIIADIGKVGQALGVLPRADSLVSDMRTSLRRLKDSVDLIPVSRRPSVFVEIGSAPLYTASSSSFIGRMIETAGGRDIADGLPQDYGTVNPETVIGKNPDIILILHPMATRADVMKRIGWSRVSAIRTGRVYDAIDLDIVLRPGPRFLQGLDELRRIMHDFRP